ncbi:MAG: flagellar export chaperone FliS [Myxococcota bacterium]
MSFALAQYKTTRVQTASPVQIVVQLYDGSIRFMRQAVEAIEDGKPSVKGELLGKAHAIVGELQATLDTSQAPELCAELERLYEFVLYRITQCTMTSDPAVLVPAIEVMQELRGAWSELAQKAGE